MSSKSPLPRKPIGNHSKNIDDNLNNNSENEIKQHNESNESNIKNINESNNSEMNISTEYLLPNISKEESSLNDVSSKIQNNNEDKIEKCLIPTKKNSENLNTDFFNSVNLFLILMVLVISLITFVIMRAPLKESKVQSHNVKYNCSFDDLKKSFPKQNHDLWKEITIGIEGILNKNPATPGVYLFLHENNDSTRKLIEKIVNTSSKCFDPNLQPVKLSTEDFISNDYGTVVEKYKQNIKDGGVLMVANLDEIPAESARALHSICDTYSPIVERVVIFLTLTVNSDEQGKLLQIAESKLNYLWGSTIEENILDALISRVTETVLRLHSE